MTPSRARVPGARAGSLRCRRGLAAALLSCLVSAGEAAEADALAELGRRIFLDTTMSEPAGTACASCHDPERAFSGDNGSGIGVARGSRPDALGFRKTPSIAYLRTLPAFDFEAVDGKRVPVGGMFWDGRADTFEEQALGPLFSPHEMNNTDAASLANRVRAAPWADELTRLFGARTWDDPETVVNALTTALGAFQRSPALSPFTSKFDAVKRGQADFTEQEERGLALFTIAQKGNCHECHVVDLDSDDPADSLFTNFRYHALGVPRNVELPATRDPAYNDLGLCDALRARDDDAQTEPWCGWFRTPSLRNVALTGPWMHNGQFKTLRDAVAFYATRDTNPERWYPDAEKFNDLPVHLRDNVDLKQRPYHRKLGKRPALKEEEVDDIVAFLHTLTDGWKPPAPSASTRP